MDRWISLLVALGLVLAACSGSDTADSTTSTSTSSSTTSANTPEPATVTTRAFDEGCKPIAIEGRGLIWEPGCVYTADTFAVPVRFTATGPGWTSTGADYEWVALNYDLDGDGGADATLTLVVHLPEAEPEQIIASIVQIPGVEALSNSTNRMLGDLPIITVDVIGDPNTNPGFTENDDGCSSPPGSARFAIGFPGYRLLVDIETQDEFGIPACYSTRVWVVDTAGISVTAMGAVKDNDRFEELMPILEGFLQNNVTFGDSDG